MHNSIFHQSPTCCFGVPTNISNPSFLLPPKVVHLYQKVIWCLFLAQPEMKQTPTSVVTVGKAQSTLGNRGHCGYVLCILLTARTSGSPIVCFLDTSNFYVSFIYFNQLERHSFQCRFTTLLQAEISKKFDRLGSLQAY